MYDKWESHLMSVHKDELTKNREIYNTMRQKPLFNIDFKIMWPCIILLKPGNKNTRIHTHTHIHTHHE